MTNGINAVIFDLGNVLLTLDWERMLRGFSAATGKSCHQLNHQVDHTDWTGQHARGEITSQEFYEIAAREVGFGGGYDDFSALFNDLFDRNEPMLELADKLKGKLPRLVLSNTNAMHMKYVFDRFPELHDFEGHVLSHELGYEKPDPRIYHQALRRYGLETSGTVFIDDLERNVEGARRVGMHAIQHRDTNQTRQELTALGVEGI